MLQNVMFDPKKGHTQAIGFPIFLMHLLSEGGIFTGAKTTIFLTSDTSGIIPSAWRLNSPYPTWQFVPGRYGNRPCSSILQCNVSLREGTWWI